MKLGHAAALALRWWKREIAVAGRRRMLASLNLFWGPIFLVAIVWLVIWILQ
jgi:hypothetical protein